MPICQTALEAVSFVLSVVCLAMGITYGIQISKAPVVYDPDIDILHKGPHDLRSAAWAIFYYGFFPFITCCISAAGTVLYSTGHGSSLYSLIVAVTFSVAWWLADGFSVQCDWVKSLEVGTEDLCPQSYMLYKNASPGEVVGTSLGVLVIKSLSGLIIGIVYLVYLSYAAIAVAKHNNLRRSRSDDIGLTGKAGVGSEFGGE
ncbi:hypothetical protein EJ08DRAFT_665530 [Tothia fuscella]|uniref:Uncharacterized protein n=1 Tax=Tothia fuscella TaxID=1048955 RepID=A0A9P4NGX9_9PEZI|nr:hypothetical protein EJ08DRAFT_665530 [Tothia fuscella]